MFYSSSGRVEKLGGLTADHLKKYAFLICSCKPLANSGTLALTLQKFFLITEYVFLTLFSTCFETKYIFPNV